MCRRGPERQAGAARPDLVNPAILPSAQPPEPIPCARHLEGLPVPASLGQGHTVQPSTVTPTPWLPYVNHPGGAAARAGRSGTGALVAPARARYGLWQSVYGLFRRWQRDGTWRKIVTLLLREKLLIKISEELVFHHSALERLRREMASYKMKSPKIDVTRFKELTGVSRKYAIPLLEYLDRERVTRRVGDERVIL